MQKRKIKNCKISLTLVFFVVICAVSAAVRYVQFAAPAIDFETGFYISRIGLLDSLFYITLGAGLAGLIVFAAADKIRRHTFFTKDVDGVDATECLIMGFMLILAAAASLFTAVSDFAETAENPILLLAAVLGIAGYAAAGALLFIKKRVTKAAGYAFIIPCVYHAVRSFHGFVEHLVITRMSEYLVALLINICLVFFFLGAGRVFSKNEGRLTRARVMIFGFAASGMIFAEAVSKVIFWLGSSDAMREILGSPTSTFITPDMRGVSEGIAVITLLIVLLGNPVRKNEEQN